MHPTSSQHHPLSMMLAVAVPLHILQIKERGGPTMQEFQDLANLDPVLERADSLLLYRGKETKPGQIAEAFNELARGIAIMSFVPGGITVFNQHYQSTSEAETNENTSEPSAEPPASAV